MGHPILSRICLLAYLAVFNLLAPPVLLPCLPFLLLIRKRRKTIFQRLGFESYPTSDRSTAKPVWVHALSVGELLSCVPLIRELRDHLPGKRLLLSVSTLTAHEIAAEKLGVYVDGLFYFPYDFLPAVRKCVDRVRPALFLLVETDIWPGFLAEMRRNAIPCLLLNARLSPRSLQFSRMISHLLLPAFDTFQRIYPQSAEEAKRFVSLGLKPEKIQRPGNLKFDLAGGFPSPELIMGMRQSLNIRDEDRVLLAGSTHPGEEVMLRSAFIDLRQCSPGLKLVIVPRHPDRAAEIERLFHHDSFGVRLLSQGVPPHTDVIVVDCMGLLGSLYALADVAFVGGSLVKKGGQNPIEPAAAGKPVLFGPDMSDFPDVSRILIEAGGAIQVQDARELTEQCARLLGKPELAMEIGRRARFAVVEHQGISRTLAADIAAFLDRIEARPA